MPTPDFLRGSAVAQIIATMHTRGEGGPWSLEAVDTAETQHGIRSTLMFCVGIIYPEAPQEDKRQRVLITVEELT